MTYSVREILVEVLGTPFYIVHLQEISETPPTKNYAKAIGYNASLRNTVIEQDKNYDVHNLRDVAALASTVDDDASVPGCLESRNRSTADIRSLRRLDRAFPSRISL